MEFLKCTWRNSTFMCISLKWSWLLKKGLNYLFIFWGEGRAKALCKIRDRQILQKHYLIDSWYQIGGYNTGCSQYISLSFSVYLKFFITKVFGVGGGTL